MWKDRDIATIDIETSTAERIAKFSRNRNLDNTVCKMFCFGSFHAGKEDLGVPYHRPPPAKNSPEVPTTTATTHKERRKDVGGSARQGDEHRVAVGRDRRADA